MEGSIRIQGRDLSAGDIEHIRGLLASLPHWSRRRLAQQVCQDWDWCNASDVLEDMATRSLLSKLEQRGVVQLPQSRRLMDRHGGTSCSSTDFRIGLTGVPLVIHQSH